MNVGLNTQLAKESDYIIFLDQDSCLENNQANTLADAFEELEKEGHKVGGIGPEFISEFSNEPLPHGVPVEIIKSKFYRYNEVTFHILAIIIKPISIKKF